MSFGVIPHWGVDQSTMAPDAKPKLNQKTRLSTQLEKQEPKPDYE